MTKTESFTIAFVGPALDSGKMNVRDLAPALISLSDICEEANKILNGPNARVTLEIQATNVGSFETVLSISQDVITQVRDFFLSSNVTSIANMVSILGFSGVGVPGILSLIKRSKGKSPKAINTLESGEEEFVFEEFTEKLPSGASQVYRSMKIRKSFHSMLLPVERDGIDAFEIRSGKDTSESVAKEELKYFKAPELEDEILEESERRAVFQISSLAFSDGKWRLSDGNNTIFVRITDHEFLQKVVENVTGFYKDDFLIVNLKTTSKQTSDGLKTEYEVTKVHEHRTAARQIPLPLK